MTKDFVIKRLLRDVSFTSSNELDLPLTPEKIEFILDFYLEGVFNAIKTAKDVQIPYVGKFVVYGPSYAAEMRFRELATDGVTDKERIKEECSRVARDAAIALSAENRRTLKILRPKGEKVKRRVHRLPGQGEGDGKDTLRGKFVTPATISSQWMERVIEKKKLLKKLKKK